MSAEMSPYGMYFSVLACSLCARFFYDEIEKKGRKKLSHILKHTY